MPSRPPSTRSRIDLLRDHIDRAFPPGPRARLGPGRLEWTVVMVAVLALATILALLRLGWSSSLNTIWAEDGPIYLQAALTQGFWHAVFSPYAGYLVVVPRLIAEAATLVPLQYAPAAISIVSASVAALSGLCVWVASDGHVRNPYLRGGLALAVVLAPTAGLEALDSAAYAPWYMLIATFWLLFWRPRTMWGAGLAGAFILLTGLSTPGVWFFLPVAVLRGLTVRDRRDAVVVGAFALGATVQVPVILGQEQGAPLWTHDIWPAYLQRVVDGGVFGQRLGGGLWSELGWPFLIVLSLALLAGLVYALRRSAPSARWFAALALPTSLVMFVLSAYQRTVGSNLIWSAGSAGGTASRYVLVPALLLVSAGVVLADATVGRRQGSRGLPWVVGATSAILLLAIVTSFDMRDPARSEPHWKDALRSAARTCVSEHRELAGIATSPSPFGVQIPCEEIASFARRVP
jgi:hypothetical protein